MHQTHHLPPERHQSEFLRDPEGFYWGTFVPYAVVSYKWKIEAVVRNFPPERWCENFLQPMKEKDELHIAHTEQVLQDGLASKPKEEVDAAKQGIAEFRRRYEENSVDLETMELQST